MSGNISKIHELNTGFDASALSSANTKISSSDFMHRLNEASSKIHNKVEEKSEFKPKESPKTVDVKESKESDIKPERADSKTASEESESKNELSKDLAPQINLEEALANLLDLEEDTSDLELNLNLETESDEIPEELTLESELNEGDGDAANRKLTKAAPEIKFAEVIIVKEEFEENTDALGEKTELAGEEEIDREEKITDDGSDEKIELSDKKSDEGFAPVIAAPILEKAPNEKIEVKIDELEGELAENPGLEISARANSSANEKEDKESDLEEELDVARSIARGADDKKLDLGAKVEIKASEPVVLEKEIISAEFTGEKLIEENLTEDISAKDFSDMNFKFAEKIESRSDDRVIIEKPAQEQVKIAISQALSSGRERIQVTLTPESLGKVEINLDIQNGSLKNIKIYAEKIETLDAIIKDSQILEEAVKSVAKDSDVKMSFHFREESNGQEFERREAQRDAAEVFDKTLVAVSEGGSSTGPNGHISDDAVDIRI